MKNEILSPEAAVDELIKLHAHATKALKASLDLYFANRTPPTPEQRDQFCYPQLRVTYVADGLQPSIARAYAKFQRPGTYVTTVTQPAHFKRYLVAQLKHLAEDYNAKIEVGFSTQEIPYPYVLESGNDLGKGNVTAAELALHFPIPQLALVGDEIADGQWDHKEGDPFPLALFDAVRVDFSLKRLQHYTGTHWKNIQPWILLTNYHRYVDQFIKWGIEQLSQDGPYEALHLPGGGIVTRGMDRATTEKVLGASQWHKFQMPAYHLARNDGEGGETLVNIGVGPSNAKNMTDHLAVLRPHCWLMIGHCGGLRQSQRIGDYVLAHAYLREDHILDYVLPPAIPIPALAEVQLALQHAAAEVTGETGDALKARLRTGTVVTYDDRNWELHWSMERKRINLSRAIAVDMESGTLAAQGFRFRVPYGTLLCVSDKPLHGEIKLPGAANAFYDRAVAEHLLIGLTSVEKLRASRLGLHSRKLRSFDEPPFR
ncbi:MAG: AMP nucleosidase [Alphaproteobacteria bacterium]|nr:AMP nucleosidase [Alphaproteobacteria bacterium]